MSSTPYSSPFRHRTLGRAPSPPTWACYEQIPYDDEYSDESASDDEDNDNSCSEDDEDYGHVVPRGEREESDESAPHDDLAAYAPPPLPDKDDNSMEEDYGGDAEKSNPADLGNTKKDIKGKQRAVDPEHIVEEALPPSPKKSPHSRRRRPTVRTLRPILTIQKSQGFVWNQDLFVPPYIKDRYIASTSPPNATGFVSSSASSTNSFPDYEVDVVEIRVDEEFLNGIIP